MNRRGFLLHFYPTPDAILNAYAPELAADRDTIETRIAGQFYRA